MIFFKFIIVFVFKDEITYRKYIEIDVTFPKKVPQQIEVRFNILSAVKTKKH